MKNLHFISVCLILLFFLSTAFTGNDNNEDDKNNTVALASIDNFQQREAPLHTAHSESEVYSNNTNPGWNDFPSLHPMVVHFPVVLLLIALLTQLASFLVWKNELSILTLLILTAGTAGAFIASNYAHPHTTELNDVAAELLIQHELYAGYTKWLSLAAVKLKALSHFMLKRKFWAEFVVVIIMFGSAYSVSQAGHYGAALTHLQGIGVQGKYLESHKDDHSH